MSTIYHLRGEDGIERFTGTITPPPGGGSGGNTVLLGPFTIGFADLPNDGDKFDIITLPLDTAILDWWIDPDTLVAFNPTDCDIFFGQGAAWSADTHHGQWGEFTNLLALDAATAVASGQSYDLGGAATQSKLRVTQDTSPVQAWNSGGGFGAPYTVGSLDFYLVVGVPPIPTSL